MMKDLSYFQLRAFLHPRERENKVTFTLSEIEQVWFCTRKNVKRKIKQFEEAHQLTYEPGKGRGNKSTLTFHVPFQQEIESYVKYCVEKDNLDYLMELLQLPIPKSWISSVSQEVQELFGFHEAKEEKDTLRTVIHRSISTIDPLYSSITFENHLISQLGDTLVIYKPNEEDVSPHLAHHWVMTNHYQKWTFYLRKGVRFHHHKELTSEDVRYTFERFFDADSPSKWLVQEIQSIECPTPHKVIFNLKNPNPFFVRYLSSKNLTILPSDIEFNENKWIGTGAFQLKEMNENKIVVEAFDFYFLERAILDRVEFWKVPKEEAFGASFQVNDDQEKQDSYQIEDIEPGFRFLGFNFKRSSAVHDTYFREAIYHLLNMKQLWKDTLDNGTNRGKLATSYFPWNSNPASIQKDATKIKELLSKSTYQGDSLTLYTLHYPNAQQEAIWLRDKGKEYGIIFEIHTFDFGDFYTPMLENNADLAFSGEVASTDYHLSFLGAFYNKALLFRRFFPEEHIHYIDKKLEVFKSEKEVSKRNDIIEEVEGYLRSNNLIIFQHHPLKKRSFDPMIQDVQFDSFGFIDFRRLWIQ